jgi:hypothetical protein
MKTLLDVSICFEINNSDYNSNYNDYLKLKEKWKEIEFLPLLNLDQSKQFVKLYRRVKLRTIQIKEKIFKLITNQKSEQINSIRYQSLINQPFLLNKSNFVNHIAEILKKKQFDIIQIEFISLGPIVYILPSESVKVLVHHEIRYIRIKREVELFNNIEPFDICRLGAIKDQEISLLQRFDKIITLTENDKKILSKNISPLKIYVSPATIKPEKKQSVIYSPFNNRLVFIGSSIHLPNKDGLDWFINFIMPLIEQKRPDIFLDIIGTWDKNFIKKYRCTNIKFLGFVEDLTNSLTSSLLIVPIRIGSGMRLKIIEAINHHIPFITTSIGIEGLDFENGVDCIIADTPENFAKGIVGLSNDSYRQQEFVTNASLKLKESYSFESAIKKRLDFYKNLP